MFSCNLEVANRKSIVVPWYHGNYPPSYKNQPGPLREKAVEIANGLLKEGAAEGIAIATGLKKAREYFENQNKENDERANETPGTSH